MVPCLEYGSVELFSAAPNGSQLSVVVNQMKKGRVGSQIPKIPIVFFKITAPLFVINSLNNFKKLQDDSYIPDLHIPKIDDIQAKDLETGVEIAESIKLTLESCFINESSYIEDGCNRFTASLTTTVSTYWSGLIYGDLETWWMFSQEKHAPLPIKIYQKAVEDLLRAEYLNIDDLIRRSR